MKDVLAVVAAIVTFGIGVFVGLQNKAESAPHCPEKVQSVMPVRPKQLNFDQPAQKSRPEIIAEMVKNYHRYSDELNNIAVFNGKNVEQVAGTVQYVFDFGERFKNLRKEYNKHGLSDLEVGFTEKDLRQSEIKVYQKTIEGLNKVSALGGTNRCIWEGGCFGSKAEIDDLKRKIQEWHIAPLQ